MGIGDIEGFNTEIMQSMKRSFFGCKKLTNFASLIDTKNVKDISGMFADSSIINFDFSKYDTHNVVKYVSYVL